MRRVVVTGLGMLSPLGNSPELTWQNLLLGKSGIGDIEHFDTSEYPTRFAGLIKDFDAQEYMEKKEAKKMDLFIQYGVAAGVHPDHESRIGAVPTPAPRAVRHREHPGVVRLRDGDARPVLRQLREQVRRIRHHRGLLGRDDQPPARGL